MNILKIACALLTMAASSSYAAEQFVPPTDSSQSIKFWKAHTILPSEDAGVEKAHRIFRTLLGAWDRSRVEPGLSVVRSSAGPWAASLADGNILLSRDAIDSCEKFGRARATHLLAFVLAHEMAHQRASDLWHQQFFRLVGSAAPKARGMMLRGLKIGSEQLNELEQREARADHNGLVTMASVGYDPFQIVDQKDFFTAWVENLWGKSCADATLRSAARQACEKAQVRALRTRTQLGAIASQATLYELGIQAFIADDMKTARSYFKAYGRDYPGRAVYSSLGLTYLREALVLQTQLHAEGLLPVADFYYPLLLDAAPRETLPSIETGKRGTLDTIVARRHQLLQAAIGYFERALHLEPDHPGPYYLQGLAHVIDGNTFMARGILQGQFQPRFQSDPAIDLLLAITRVLENDIEAADVEFAQLLARLQRPGREQSLLPQTLLRFSSYHNAAALARLKGDDNRAQAIWKQLAASAKSSGDGTLFRLALANTGSRIQLRKTLKSHPLLRGLRLGDKYVDTPTLDEVGQILWLDGEHYALKRGNDGSRFVVNRDGRIVRAWQEAGSASTLGGIRIGDAHDRPLKSLGPPNREYYLQRGSYLAYDSYGIALHLVAQEVVGWFLYDPG